MIRLPRPVVPGKFRPSIRVLSLGVRLSMRVTQAAKWAHDRLWDLEERFVD